MIEQHVTALPDHEADPQRRRQQENRQQHPALASPERIHRHHYILARVSGVVAGALVGVALFALDFLVGRAGFMGMRDPRVIDLVLARARMHAVGQQLLGLLVLTSACAAFAAVTVAAARAWGLRRRTALFGALGALAGHSFFLLRSMSQFPALYEAHFYEPGGARRALLEFATDDLRPASLDLWVAGVLVLFFFPLLLQHFKRALVVVGAVSLLALAANYWPRAHYAPAHQKRNLLVIAVDSLRADRLFGIEIAGPTIFPNFWSLASRGVRFRQAYVTQARTFPSFVTLLTGRWSAHHGIRHEFPTAAARAAIGPSLPSILHDNGWQTSAVSDFAGEIFSRAPLFEHNDVPRLDLFSIVGEQILASHPNLLPYASTRLGRRIFPATGVAAELEDPAALAERAGAEIDRLSAKPFFLTVFFSAPHTPYAAPSPWWNRHAGPGEYRGRYRYLKQPLPQLPVLPPDDAEQVQHLYDGAVASVDDAVGTLLQRLADDGLAEDTLVVLLGDHGENLFEVPGRGMGHGDHLWGDLANHIPLVIAAPGQAPRDVDGIVRDVDLAPTLARLLGVPAPPGDGVDLAPLLDGSRPSLDLDAYEESGLWLLSSGPGYRKDDRLPYPDLWHITEAAPDGDIFLSPRWEQPSNDAKYRALRTPHWKLVYQPAPAGTAWRLFDLDADPDQRRDVAAEHPDVMAQLRPRLERWIQR
jgi:arylsulfatase A-like enzyme